MKSLWALTPLKKSTGKTKSYVQFLHAVVRDHGATTLLGYASPSQPWAGCCVSPCCRTLKQIRGYELFSMSPSLSMCSLSSTNQGFASYRFRWGILGCYQISLPMSVSPVLTALGMCPFLTMTLLWVGLPLDLVTEPPAGCALPSPAMALAPLLLERPESCEPTCLKFNRGKCTVLHLGKKEGSDWLRVKAARWHVCCLTREKRTIYYL